MNRLTERTENGIKLGDTEYNTPGILLKALTLLADYEDSEMDPHEFKEFEEFTFELNKRLRPFFDKYANGCEYRIKIPTIGICCNAYSCSTRSDHKYWAHFPLCEGQHCVKLYPFLLEYAKIERNL